MSEPSADQLGRKLSFGGKLANGNEFAVGSSGISRERSFIRMPGTGQHNQHALQQQNKRRSLAFGHPHTHALQQQQMRGKPAIELYRPPNYFSDARQQSPGDAKLNVHAQEFQMARGDHLQNSRSSMALFHGGPTTHSNGTNGHSQQLQNSKSNQNLLLQQQQQQQIVRQLQQQQRASLVLQQQQQQQLHAALAANAAVASQQSGARVKFAPEPHHQLTAALQHHHHQHQHQHHQQQPQQQLLAESASPLQRSKSLSSAADAIARGIAGLGLGVVADHTELGTFADDVQALVDQARLDPNQLGARQLMQLAHHIMQRAVTGRRYALPTSRFCIAVVSQEHSETFLDALLNTCRRWYQERDQVLGTPAGVGIRNAQRPRFTAFMAFLTEMFCQLKRRQLQLRTQCDGVPPAQLLLTVLAKCCEDCVRPPVRSLSEIECLFFVLTCIGRDLEQQLPQQLEALLAAVRDAFLNASASAPAIRRTLLQLIELQASRWQLPGNTVLYYYPSNK